MLDCFNPCFFKAESQAAMLAQQGILSAADGEAIRDGLAGIAADLRARGVEYKDVGTFTEASVDYPVYARAVCDEITSGRAEFGILCCGTGIGMSIAANKRRGIRAAVLSDAFSAEMTRRHNDANVLCLGGRVIDAAKAVELARIFLATPFEGGRHAKRVAMLEE